MALDEVITWTNWIESRRRKSKSHFMTYENRIKLLHNKRKERKRIKAPASKAYFNIWCLDKCHFAKLYFLIDIWFPLWLKMLFFFDFSRSFSPFFNPVLHIQTKTFSIRLSLYNFIEKLWTLKIQKVARGDIMNEIMAIFSHFVFSER